MLYLKYDVRMMRFVILNAFPSHSLNEKKLANENWKKTFHKENVLFWTMSKVRLSNIKGSEDGHVKINA